MVLLIDSAIGFAAIMLMLSLLVKSLTSLVKNYVDYYSENLRSEVDQFLNGMVGAGLNVLEVRFPWVRDINWKSLGEEFLTRDKMELLLRQISPTWTNMGDLDMRLSLHVANLKYAFEQRMKNLALAIGLGLCMFLNVNAVTIWTTLYTDQQVRSTFATSYAEKAMAFADKAANNEPAAAPKDSKAKLDEQAKTMRESVGQFMTDVQFGVGRIWREGANLTLPGFLFELLASLLTGILVSIGAPYWHDLLRALANLRKPERE